LGATTGKGSGVAAEDAALASNAGAGADASAEPSAKAPPNIEGSGEEIWRRACDHVVALAAAQGVVSAGPQGLDALRFKCLEDFAATGEETGDTAARCILQQGSLDGMDPCVLPLKKAGIAAVKALPEGQDPWSAVVAMRGELYRLVRDGLRKPADLPKAVNAWMKKNLQAARALCVRTIQIPRENPETNYTAAIRSFEEAFASASFEALAQEILSSKAKPEVAKEIIASVMEFDRVCREAQAIPTD